MTAQNRHACLAAGLPEAEVESYCRLLCDAFDAITAKSPLPSADDYDISDALKQNYNVALKQFCSPYMEYFLGLDISRRLPAVTCPVMALCGIKDTQVQCGWNLEALRAGLHSDGRNVIRAEEGLNHLFQHCSTGELSEYKEIEETFSYEVLSEMISWIKAL